MTGPAARRWAEDLAAWAIPEHILGQAPESPWGCPPKLFARSAEKAASAATPRSPSHRRALEALPEGGSVLDVGAGAGAASLSLVPPAGRLWAVDQSAGMLDAFAELAGRLGVAHEEVEGPWPAVADQVPPTDVAVCHHVFYNVADLVPFVEALTARARNRVVVEITEEHPQSRLNDLWRRFHGIERPTRPTVDDAVAVLIEIGLDVDVERFDGPDRWDHVSHDELVHFARRRLCLPPERDPEIAEVIEEIHRPRRVAAIWWPGTAT